MLQIRQAKIYQKSINSRKVGLLALLVITITIWFLIDYERCLCQFFRAGAPFQKGHIIKFNIKESI